MKPFTFTGSLPLLTGLVFWLLATAGQVQATPPATQPASRIDNEMRISLAWQIALDAANFSPGLIDGKFGRRGKMALQEYTAANFPGAKLDDPRVATALGVDLPGVLTSHEITAQDLAQVGGTLPTDWNEKAQLKAMLYETLLDAMGERFRCSRGLLQTLNPGVDFAQLKAGQTITVPNIRPLLTQPLPLEKLTNRTLTGVADHIAIDLSEKTMRVFDAKDKQLALFHCSIAKDKEKLPTRDLQVKDVVVHPNYTFDPKMWPDVTNVKKILTIQPGPRNPVGLAWITLDLPGYGMHGTPTPEMIGKTGSHGCFRLANWDALTMTGILRRGLTIKILHPPAAEQ
jgi:lipoprotein-anchoring transpeptidase ErfK/SrfK